MSIVSYYGRVITLEFFESPTVFLAIGDFRIYWYGIMYVVAFWFAWFSLPRLGKKRGIVLLRDQWTSIVALGAFGALVGGRLGYALFYEPLYFFTAPLEIFQIWNGGMSSHGGFIGVMIGVYCATRRILPLTPPLSQNGRGERVLFSIADVATVPVAFGLALGRFGNIINQEFGMYPYYEAAGDVLIAIVCYVVLHASVVSSPLPFWERERVRGVTRNTQPLIRHSHKGSWHLLPEQEKGAPHGTTFAVFLILYSILRFLLEYLRPQDFALLFGLSRGQLLTIPLLILAMILLKNARNTRVY